MAWKNVSPLSVFPHSPLPFRWRRAQQKALWQINFSFSIHMHIMLSKLLSFDSAVVLKAIPSPQHSWLKISFLILRLVWRGFEYLIPHDRYLGAYNTEMSKPQQAPCASMSYLKGGFANLPLFSSFLPPSVSFLLLSEPNVAFCAQVLLLNHFCLTFWLCWKQKYGDQGENYMISLFIEKKIVNYIKSRASKIATNIFLYKHQSSDYTDVVESRAFSSQFSFQEIRPEYHQMWNIFSDYLY